MLEYKLITEYYGDRVANRSQLPLINHINEGLVILTEIGASEQARKAFCLHPLLQNDNDLIKNYLMVTTHCEAYTVMLVMEYRSVANKYLSDKVNMTTSISLSPLTEVNDMLIADKVQNYKDFTTYHKNTHPRSGELDLYFRRWLNTLDAEYIYEGLCQTVEEHMHGRGPKPNKYKKSKYLGWKVEKQ